MSEEEYKYFKKVTGVNSVYRTKKIKFSDGTPSTSLERWNWDFENWGGHIHNHQETRKLLKEGIEIVPISKKEALDKISND